ncbi:hypothetical protein LEP1GSC037_2809 [Leptospira interrogans str. 2006001854]|uniref:Uncharacterized protein n=2 Tax=Leptospira interrogans TaxID=173 RepID=M6ZW49_LEPIR|nr:hypothetical protein LEP1GSC037_2809 [Leptospira interrogans str. 2006001854]EMP05995.1 hypothetical protein LEP1GSC124_4315 [Leptospira interrogans serovar Pyrogenes str. 200701872]
MNLYKIRRQLSQYQFLHEIFVLRLSFNKKSMPTMVFYRFVLTKKMEEPMFQQLNN